MMESLLLLPASKERSSWSKSFPSHRCGRKSSFRLYSKLLIQKTWHWDWGKRQSFPVKPKIWKKRKHKRVTSKSYNLNLNRIRKTKHKLEDLHVLLCVNDRHGTYAEVELEGDMQSEPNDEGTLARWSGHPHIGIQQINMNLSDALDSLVE